MSLPTRFIPLEAQYTIYTTTIKRLPGFARNCKKYGLEPNYHQVQKRGTDYRAADMEHHAGVESLLGWIQRECYAELKNAGSWNELHQVMVDNGLVLKERGNGIVVEAQNGIQVKASSIDRAFSKSKLEERFGSFEPSPFQFHQVDEEW